MGAVVPFDDPSDYGLVKRRVQRLLAEGSIFIPPYARARMVQRGMDDTDIVQILRGGSVRPNSHSLVGGEWRWVIEGSTADFRRAACVIEIKGSVVVVTAYVLSERR